MKLPITGASGFVGGALWRAARQEGYQTIALGRRPLAAGALAGSCAWGRRAWGRVLLGLTLVAISVSIVALRQHTDLDTLAGLGLGAAGLAAYRGWPVRRSTPATADR